ncbi:MAG TPA: TetR/AcrR family transcriptional regulator [Acidimicrobiales bacterium]|nr:TetR/AcrR family transcriptional regulator [Acidimicrobiales bacterium]
MSRSPGLPDRLVAAIGEAVREVGPSGVSLRDVARRAGVSHAAPAHHFGNKAGMLAAFAAEGYRQLAASVTEEIERSGCASGADQLAAVGRGYVRFAIERPEYFEVMFRPDALDLDVAELIEATDAAYGLLVGTIARCDSEGSLAGRDPIVVGVAAWSLVHGLASLLLSGRLAERIPATDPTELAAAVSALFVSSVLAG